MVGEEPVRADLAVELIRYNDRLRPSDLNGTSLGHRVNRGEVDRVSGHIGDLVGLLVELELLDLRSELVHDAGRVLRVGRHLVEIFIGDDDVLEAGGWLRADRVSDVFDTPLEGAGAVLHHLEFDLHGATRNSALNFTEAENSRAVEVLTGAGRAKFRWQLERESVTFIKRDVRLHGEDVLVAVTVNEISLCG